jgi:hypothetical protein
MLNAINVLNVHFEATMDQFLSVPSHLKEVGNTVPDQRPLKNAASQRLQWATTAIILTRAPTASIS